MNESFIYEYTPQKTRANFSFKYIYRGLFGTLIRNRRNIVIITNVKAFINNTTIFLKFISKTVTV